MMPVTSQISIPMAKAKGVVQFTNLGADEIAIPAGTIVSTESLIHFATLNDTRLPAGADQIVEVQIEATDAGANGNVEAGAIHLIEGPLGLSATVTNLEPTNGGSDSKVIGASDDERTQLRTMVLSKLQENALSQIRSQIGANDLLLEDTLEMGNIQNEEYAPPDGKAGATLTLTMQTEFSARYILANDLRQLASSAVLASIPRGFSPFGDMKFSFLNSPATDSSGVTHFQLQASQAALRDVDRMQLFNLIRGHSPIDAQNELTKQFAFRQPPEISITPSWWKWLPLIPFNISVEVK